MADTPVMISRTLTVAGSAAEAARGLAAAPGIASARGTPDGRELHVTYDLRLLRLDDVERLLSAAGVPPAGGPLQVLRRRWARFTEENLVQQSRIVHQCCNSIGNRE